MTTSGTVTVSGGDLDVDSTASNAVFFLTGTLGMSGASVTCTVDGAFENDGEVSVTGSSAVFETKGSGVRNSSSGDWTLNGTSAQIKLSPTSAVDIDVTGGEFHLTNGTLDVNKDFRTQGSILWDDSDATIDTVTLGALESFTVCHGGC